MTDVERRILENQEVILLGISKLLAPQCKGIMDSNGETSKMSVDLLDEKSACLLSDAQLNRLITVLNNARDHRKEEAKNKTIQDFYNAWSKLRELGITPYCLSKENVYYDSDDDVYRIDLNNFDEFRF